jgi:tRNA nucleotidyltransferase (CCA-adding enzyme)
MTEVLRDESVLIRGKLNENFNDVGVENEYYEYEIDTPDEVLVFAEVIKSLGGRVLLVGGCVRDAIRAQEENKGKIKPKDIDIEVYGIDPIDLLKVVETCFCLKESGTIGKNFDVLKVFGKDGSFDLDISIPREDSKVGSGSKGFETTSRPDFSITEAGRRRDLTCNSVSYDPLEKIVYDPFGGVDDIKNKIIRVTDKEQFQDDPVRILRMMQFAARFGWEVESESEKLCAEMLERDKAIIRRNKRVIIGGTDEETKTALELMRNSAIELDNEPNERVFGEFKKMLLKSNKPSIGLEFARRIGLLDRYFPWMAQLTITDQDARHHPEGNVWIHTMKVLDAGTEIAIREGLSDEDRLTLQMACLSHDVAKPVKTIRQMVEIDGMEVEVISSGGHDSEGGWMSEEFINAFAPKRNKNFEPVLRSAVKVLVEEHMRPFQYYLEAKDGQDSKRKLGRLAQRLARGGTTIQMLSYLAEADQRGRKQGAGEISSREEVSELVEWQSWLEVECEKHKIYEKLPEPILSGSEVMQVVGIGPGVRLGLIMTWCHQDQIEGLVTDQTSAMNKAREYNQFLNEKLDLIIQSDIKGPEINGKMSAEAQWMIWMKQREAREMVCEYLE